MGERKGSSKGSEVRKTDTVVEAKPSPSSGDSGGKRVPVKIFVSDDEYVLSVMEEEGFSEKDIKRVRILLLIGYFVRSGGCEFSDGYVIRMISEMGTSRQYASSLLDRMKEADLIPTWVPYEEFDDRPLRGPKWKSGGYMISSGFPSDTTDYLDRSSLQGGDLTIPRGAVSVPKGYFMNVKISIVNLPSGMKYIEDYAFYGCNLRYAKLPEGLLHIGKKAFGGENEIFGLFIPRSLRSIGSMAYESRELKVIKVTEGNEYFCTLSGVLFDKSRKTLIKYPAKMEADVYYVPDTVETIADGAFQYANIGKVVLPKKLKSIGSYAFMLAKIGSMEIPDSVERIGEGAFLTASLKSIAVPPKVLHIEDLAFSSCYIQNITFKGPVETIGAESFRYCAFRSIELPDSLRRIGNMAFKGSQIESVVLPPELERLGEGAFIECSKLSYVKFPPSLLYISENCFANCTSLRSVSLPSDIFFIARGAFCCCTDLCSVDLGESLEGIGPNAFSGTISLGVVNFPGTLRRIGDNAFSGSGLRSVDIPSSVHYVGKESFFNDRLRRVTLSEQTKVEKDAFSPKARIVYRNEDEKKDEKKEGEGGGGLFSRLRKMF